MRLTAGIRQDNLRPEDPGERRDHYVDTVMIDSKRCGAGGGLSKF